MNKENHIENGPSDERDLVEAARGGDLSAFNQLVALYEQRIYNLAYRFLDDKDEAADVTQDVFIAAYRYLPEFQGGSFRAWLFRVATNNCYDRLRVRKRRPAVSLEAIIDNEENASRGIADPAESPEEFTLRRALSTEINTALQQLPPDQLIVTILFDVKGLSLDEVASSLKLPIGTVKSRLSRARARLRDYLFKENRELFSRYFRSDSEG